jgi:hypothetical protein
MLLIKETLRLIFNSSGVYQILLILIFNILNLKIIYIMISELIILIIILSTIYLIKIKISSLVSLLFILLIILNLII